MGDTSSDSGANPDILRLPRYPRARPQQGRNVAPSKRCRPVIQIYQMANNPRICTFDMPAAHRGERVENDSAPRGLRQRGRQDRERATCTWLAARHDESPVVSRACKIWVGVFFAPSGCTTVTTPYRSLFRNAGQRTQSVLGGGTYGCTPGQSPQPPKCKTHLVRRYNKRKSVAETLPLGKIFLSLLVNLCYRSLPTSDLTACVRDRGVSVFRPPPSSAPLAWFPALCSKLKRDCGRTAGDGAGARCGAQRAGREQQLQERDHAGRKILSAAAAGGRSGDEIPRSDG